MSNSDFTLPVGNAPAAGVQTYKIETTQNYNVMVGNVQQVRTRKYTLELTGKKADFSYDKQTKILTIQKGKAINMSVRVTDGNNPPNPQANAVIKSKIQGSQQNQKVPMMMSMGPTGADGVVTIPDLGSGLGIISGSDDDVGTSTWTLTDVIDKTTSVNAATITVKVE